MSNFGTLAQVSSPKPAPPLNYSVPPELNRDAMLFYDSKRKMTGLIIFGVFNTLLGFATWRNPGRIISENMTYLCLLAGPITVVGAAWRLARTKPRIIIDRTGIRDNRTGLGLIPWPQILGVAVGAAFPNVPGFPKVWVLCLTVTDANMFNAKRGKLGSLGWSGPFSGAGPNAVAIPLAGLAASTSEIVQVIERFRNEAGRS